MIFKYNTAEIIITVNITKISGIAPIPELITPANKYNFAIKPPLIGNPSRDIIQIAKQIENIGFL